MLMLTSIFIALVGPAPTVAASNETTSGTITGTEYWQGTHELTGDVVVSSGAKLIIEPSTNVVFPNGTHLDARGSICVGLSSCGASGNANSAQRITFSWNEPENESAEGECNGISQGQYEITITDPSCYEGIIIRDSIDLSQSGLRFLTIDGAWGIPHFVDNQNGFKYAALVLDGASPILTELDFQDIASSSVLTTGLAQPQFVGGEYIVGNDEDSGVDGPAVQIYSSGTPITPLIMSSPVLIGSDNGCGNNAGGKPTVWVDDAFIQINDAEIPVGDYGISLRYSSGSVTNSDISVNCNGIDIYSLKSVGQIDYHNTISGNEIVTSQRTPITVYGGGHAYISNNELSGAVEGSGIAVFSSFAEITDNEIGPIGGWNGLWMYGSFDVIAENNTIFDTNREAIIAGEYGNNAPAPSAARAFLANNTISTDPATCSSPLHFGGEFTCPAVFAYRTGLTMYDNDIDAGNSDGIRSIGALLDIRRNNWNAAGTGAILKHYDSSYAGDQQYGTLAFFSENTWNGVGTTYNITKSAVTVQSETIPSPPEGQYPIILSWPDQEAWPQNGFQNGIIPTEVQECSNCDNLTPINFPLALSMDNNSTVLTFAGLSNIDRSSIAIQTQPTPYAVQVRRAELVKFQALVNGERVEGASILVEDALGNDLYDIETMSDGYTPWFALPSDFHLDFRGLGGGNNPDGFADDEYEDSCSDGIDNDGDLVLDSEDDDCNHSAGTRELSLYRYTAYKFGFGLDSGEFTLDDSSYQGTANLVNLAPSVSVTQDQGHSFRKVVNITGNAHDGILASFYPTDESAQWDQKGYVHSIEVRDPFTSDWSEANLATDSSGASFAEVTRDNHPFKEWYYELDMSQMAEGDYVFQFRAYDGIDYSPISTISIKLNSQAPSVSVSSPSPLSTHSDGTVTFEGAAYDYYGCPSQCGKDISEIYFQIEGPNFQVVTPVSGGTSWTWTWDFSGQPRIVADFTFKIWASDSDFCNGIIDECIPAELTLTIDNSNSAPFISISSPKESDRMPVSEESEFSGVARDNDNDVTRVDIEVLDTANGMIQVHSESVTEFDSNGEFLSTWDSRSLRHNSEYQIRMRSYDGFDYSEWKTVNIIADNPPDAGNNQPVFDQTEWPDEVVLYCEINSQSADRCTSFEINLLDFFADPDPNQELLLSVYDSPDIDSDDQYPVVITISADGKARYNPTSMSFFDPEISGWSLEDVVFVASDQFSSKANSNPISIQVIGIEFLVDAPEDSRILDDETAMFTGIGLPGRTVTATISGTPVNSTVVSENSTWSLGIPASRISGSATPQFKYGGMDYEGSKITVSEPTSGGLSMIVIIAIVLVLSIGAFAYFFVEFEEDSEETGGYNKKERPDREESRFVKDDDHPGWLWDKEKEEWVPESENNQ
tara:strand:+ start:3775 stop:7965 length:4191 start_codon:yes stop_codon:yes gene_type:complete